MSTIDHPQHYQHPSGVEAIDICEHLGFNLGNAYKYLARAGKKGPAAEDLRKAAWYLRREAVRPVIGVGVLPLIARAAGMVLEHEADNGPFCMLLLALTNRAVTTPVMATIADECDRGAAS